MNAKILRDLKEAGAKFLDPEFLEGLVKIHQKLETVTGPVASVADLSQKTTAALAGKQTQVFAYQYCDNELIKSVYDLVVSLRHLIPATWQNFHLSDWMYAFAFEIWSTDAIKGQFKPRHYPGEAPADFERRRKYAARNTLPKVDRHIGFLESIQDAHAAFLNFEGLEGVTAVAGMIQSGTTAGMVDGMLLGEVVKVARGQQRRNDAILRTLYALRGELVRIADV